MKLIKEFFAIYAFLKNVSDMQFKKNTFYRDGDDSDFDFGLSDD